MKLYIPFLSVSLFIFASCANEAEKPKVIYETEKKTAEVSYQKIDSTEINIADLPIKFNGTNYLLHPVGNVRVYSSGSSRSGSSKLNNHVSYKISNYATPEITGLITNIIAVVLASVVSFPLFIATLVICLVFPNIIFLLVYCKTSIFKNAMPWLLKKLNA